VLQSDLGNLSESGLEFFNNFRRNRIRGKRALRLRLLTPAQRKAHRKELQLENLLSNEPTEETGDSPSRRWLLLPVRLGL